MFIGHEAVGFAGKRVAPRMSLGTLILASTWLDLVWPIFVLLGIEHVRIRGGSNPFLVLQFTDYPWTHSCVMAVVWSAAFAVVYWLRTRYGRGAVVAAVAVFSHWFLDFVTHDPDLPLWPGGPRVGLELWHWPAATIVVEAALFAIGVLLYIRTTRARDRVGSISLVVFVLFLLVSYVASIVGPPPPGVIAMAWGTMLTWLFPLWAWWIDRHRELRAG